MPKFLVNQKNKKIFNGIIPRYEKLKETVLWENVDQLLTFNPQNIKLKSDDYDYLEVFYYNWTNTSGREVQNVKVPRGHNINLSTTIFAENLVHYGTRPIKRITDTEFEVKQNYGIASINPSKLITDSTWAVPIKILGLKKI